MCAVCERLSVSLSLSRSEVRAECVLCACTPLSLSLALSLALSLVVSVSVSVSGFPALSPSLLVSLSQLRLSISLLAPASPPYHPGPLHCGPKDRMG